MVLAFTSYNYAQNVNIPDANFKNALLAHGVTITGSGISKIDINDDGEIQVSEANAYTGHITCESLSISDLTGIEAFPGVTSIYCSYNQLTNLNLSQNSQLRYLDCSGNSLTSLDLSNNMLLETLLCSYNSQLSSLNLGNITGLTYIECQSNGLSSLDVSHNTALASFNCSYNSIVNLDVSYNTSLTDINCRNNLLSSLDVSQNISLEYLFCSYNRIIDLDVSQNQNLRGLTCWNNRLTSLKVDNGNNNNISSFSAINNPDLTCIQVDNVAYSSTNWTSKDPWASYSNNCALSANDFELSKQVVIYPNPVSDVLTIQNQDAISIKNYSVLDINGRVLVSQSKAIQNNEINLSGLTTGIYILQLETDKGLVTKKIIKE